MRPENLAEQDDLSQHLPDNIRCVGVMSGKGGVGKSLVAALLAIAFARDGNATGILDADLTGPSIPRMFGLRRAPSGTEQSLSPAQSKKLGISIISLNLLMDREDDPVVWRGPLVARTVEQFVTDVDWSGVRYLFIDLPPGTSDVPLTVMQRLPIDGLVVVSSPQELVAMIVRKAVKMASVMKVPVLGVVHNMTHVVCPHCGEAFQLFGSNGDAETGVDLPILARMPIDPELSALCDRGLIESYEQNPFSDSVAALITKLNDPRVTYG